MLWRLIFIFPLFFLPQRILAEEKTRIGVSIPLSGSAATYGTDLQKFFLFANETLAAGAYELIFEDDRCSGQGAVTVAKKLIHINKVRSVLGVSCDTVFSSAANVYEEAGVVVVSTSSSPISGKYLFHTMLGNDEQPAPLYHYILEQHKRLGVISEETSFAQDFAKNFTALNSRKKLEIVLENYRSEDRDFRASLLRLKGKGIEGLLILSQTEESLNLVVKQLKSLKLAWPLYSVFFPGAASFLELAGDDANGIIYLDFPSLDDDLNPKGKALYQEYLAKYGKPRSGEAVFIPAFESFRALHLALQSGKQPHQFLTESQFEGLAGKWSFDRQGFWSGSAFELKVIRDGSPTRLNVHPLEEPKNSDDVHSE